MRRGPGLLPRPSALPLERLSLRAGPYLAVDLLDEGLAVLVLLLVLAGYPLGLLEDLLGPLGGLLGDPQALPGHLLGGLEPPPGGPLGPPQALLEVGEGGEEVPVGSSPRP